MKTSKLALGLLAGVGVGLLIKRYVDGKFASSNGITPEQIEMLREHFGSAPLNDGMQHSTPKYNEEAQLLSHQHGSNGHHKTKNKTS